MATAKKRPKPKRAPAKTTRRRSGKAVTPRAKARREAPAPIAELPPEPLPESIAASEVELAPAIESAPDPELPLAMPETIFAERVPPAEPDRPYPSSRRAIFFDVENTSRAQHIARVIEHLQIDRVGHRTEFLAVGNWRVIGHDTARLLARHGADLVHSAPSVGVRDWSDLRIAVAAGAWLAGARPGDVIEIVSDDRAFDAVGDVAASLGITFRRLSYRALAGAPPAEMPAAVPERVTEARSSGDRRSQRHRGRYRGRHDGRPSPPPQAPPAPPPAPAAPPPREPALPAAVEDGAEPHTAPHDEIVNVVRDLIRANPGRGVSIDAVANALKSRGFSRTPGSPRLITRLRRLKEIELNRSGMITLVDAHARSEAAPPRTDDAAPRTEEAAPAAEPAAVRDPEPAPPPAAAPAPRDEDVDEDEIAPRGNVKPPPEPEPQFPDGEEDEGPQPGNERFPTTPVRTTPARTTAAGDAGARRRRRRGGRRWRGPGRPQATTA
jgi:hypothetical protein